MGYRVRVDFLGEQDHRFRDRAARQHVGGEPSHVPYLLSLAAKHTMQGRNRHVSGIRRVLPAEDDVADC